MVNRNRSHSGTSIGISRTLRVQLTLGLAVIAAGAVCVAWVVGQALDALHTVASALAV